MTENNNYFQDDNMSSPDGAVTGEDREQETDYENNNKKRFISGGELKMFSKGKAQGGSFNEYFDDVMPMIKTKQKNRMIGSVSC